MDTNCNPDGITYPIPGNDDAIRAITLFTQIIANAVVEADNEIGLQVIETLQDDEYPEEDLDMMNKDMKEDDESESEDEEGEVEKVSLGATIGAAGENEEEEATKTFTDKDYSDYHPEEEAAAPEERAEEKCLEKCPE